MTLKSFYSHNHRLPSPWIRAVTPAPACLPPQLPKLPAGRHTGRLPSYCQGGQRRGRTGWERFNATHTHTQGLNQRGRLRQPGRHREKERGTPTPATEDTHRPLTARTAQIGPLPDSLTTFPIQTQNSGSQTRPDLQEYTNHTDIHKSRVPTPKF